MRTSTSAGDPARAVTVVVTSHNDGPFVAGAVESALAQESCEVEVLVLDDGSSDEGPAALARLAEPRVRVVCQPPRGLARTLNLGLALARTRWVALLPGHDALLPGCLAAQLDAAGAQPEPPAAVFVKPLRVDASGAPLDDASAAPPLAAPTTRGALVRALLAGEEPCATGVLLDRVLALRTGGFAPTLTVAAYRDLWLRLLRAHDAVLVTERLARATVRPGVDERQRAIAHAEHAYVLHRALAGLGLDDVAAALRPGATSPAERAAGYLEIARLVLRSGAREALGVAAEVTARALRLGAAVPRDETFAPLLAAHPGLPAAGADVRSFTVAAPSAPPVAHPAASPSLRVALEVATLDRGGLETVVYELAVGLREAGVEPLVVCTEAGGARANALRDAGVEVAILDPLDRMAHLSRLLAERDVQLLNTHFSSFGTRVATRLGIPVVCTLHNAYAWVGSGVLDAFRLADAYVDGYVAVSQSVADFCARRFAIAAERIVVLRNCVDASALEAASRDRAEARRALGIASDVRLAVQVGRIDPIKCQLATVEALRSLARERPELRAWLVGGLGDPAYAHRVRRRIAECGLEDRVVLAGERGDVPDVLAAADVFVLPSVLEGLSLAAIEAMAAGLPAVLTRTGDAELLLGEGEAPGAALPGALVECPSFGPYVDSGTLNALAASDEPPHAAGLAAALAEVLDDLPRRSALARARAGSLARTLSRERWVASHVELFTGVAAAGAARRTRALAAAAVRLDEVAARERRAADALRENVATLSRVLAAQVGAQRSAALLQRARWDLQAARGSFVETAEIVERALDKLRITHRIRSVLEDLTRRARRGSGR